MKNRLFDALSAARALGSTTPYTVLLQLDVEFSSYPANWPRLKAGPIELTCTGDSDGQLCEEYFGHSHTGIYMVALSRPARYEDSDPDYNSVVAYHVSTAARETGDVQTLFSFVMRNHRLGRDAWTQSNRRRGSSAFAIFNRVLTALWDANVQVALSAIALHAAGNWHGPPAPRAPRITEEARRLLLVRDRPRKPILRTGWFSAREHWIASALGGTVVVKGQGYKFGEPSFISDDGVTLTELPEEIKIAMKAIWFEPLEPECTGVFFRRYHKGTHATVEQKRQALTELRYWLGFGGIQDTPRLAGE